MPSSPLFSSPSVEAESTSFYSEEYNTYPPLSPRTLQSQGVQKYPKGLIPPLRVNHYLILTMTFIEILQKTSNSHEYIHQDLEKFHVDLYDLPL